MKIYIHKEEDVLLYIIAKITAETNDYEAIVVDMRKEEDKSPSERIMKELSDNQKRVFISPEKLDKLYYEWNWEDFFKNRRIRRKEILKEMMDVYYKYEKKTLKQMEKEFAGPNRAVTIIREWNRKYNEEIVKKNENYSKGALDGFLKLFKSRMMELDIPKEYKRAFKFL